MEDLVGKRVIIGGGATGMGAATAKRLVSKGAKVIVGDVNAAGLKALEPQLAGPGTGVPFVFDLAKEEDIEAIVQHCVDQFGGVDGLVIPAADNSKQNMGNDRTVLDMDIRIWERTLRVNLIGHALLMKAAIPHMVKAGGGSIVVISSGASYLGLDYMPAYAASKAGLSALVRHTARLCGKDNIRCNGVNPGLVMTEGGMVNMNDKDRLGPPQNALRRNGQGDDVAKIIAFLLSDDSAWIDGQIISANGGSHMRE
jgi:NAD(P)-dependent dehydrogenase (short-subunit alcohol dehydrogenase family)